MWTLGLGNKLDKSIKPYLTINSKRKIPVIVSYKNNSKLIKSKITYNSGKIKYEYANVNAFACELSPHAIDKISEIPEVSFICFDYKSTLCLRNSHDVLGVKHARTFNLTGKNVGVGIVDSGVYPHADLTSKRSAIAYFEDLVNGYNKPYDDNGHGTFIAGLIASSGTYTGMAPDSNLCMIKTFDSCGNGFMSDIIRGIDILIALQEKYNIKIICLPFEIPYINNLKVNPLKEIIKKAVSLNISVVAPAGNMGPQPYSIYFPGSMKEVITVGGIEALNLNKKNIKVCDFSGRGPTLDGVPKPDIVAPGFNITSLASNTGYIPSAKIKPDLNNSYKSMSGTSLSCGLIAGISALILEKTPELTPQDLKSILCLSTISIGENKFTQGSGMFVFEKIVK